MKWTSIGEALSYQDSKQRLLKTIKEDSQGRFGVWGLFNEDGDMLAWMMLKDTQKKFFELGYMVNPLFQNRGIGKKIVSDLINYSKRKTDLLGVYARVQRNNFPSISILRKNNFILDGDGALLEFTLTF